MGHFSGKFDRDLKNILKKAKGKEGKFYQILNKYGFYDVDDENNGLTTEQKAQVPEVNRRRFSQLSDAIAEMFLFMLGDEESGMLTKSAQDTVDDMDTANQMANSQLDAINNGLKAAASTGVLAPLGTVSAGMEAMKSMMGAILGKSYYNVNILPQFTFGLDGFARLGQFGSVIKPGTLRPNWNFLYDNEKLKSNKFFVGDDGRLRISTNIDINEGNELYLKKIFGVVTTDKNLELLGDIKGGLTQQEFSILRKAVDLGSTSLGDDGDEDIKTFRLNDAQMRASFIQYVEMKLWNVINNREHWSHGHWGALTHNSMPESVKTAVCSYIWTNGLALEMGKSEESALISYLAHMGLLYTIGFQHPAKIYGFPSDLLVDFEGDKGIINGQLQDFSGDVSVEGLPKNDKIARRYFIWIADILSRLTYNSLSEDFAQHMRKRRIAEANLIYESFGLPIISYGIEITKLPFEHTIDGLKQRKLDKLFKGMRGSFWRYPNEGGPGGNPQLNPNQESSAIINFTSTARVDTVSEETKIYLKQLMEKANVGTLTITSTLRKPVDQARVMFNNLNRNNIISYRQPGAAVTNVYFKEKQRLGYQKTEPVNKSTDINDIINKMREEINAWGPENVSRHCGIPTVVNVIDIAPNSIKDKSGFNDPRSKSNLKFVIENEVVGGTITKFLHPGNSEDQAFHIEIPQPTSASTSKNDALPNVLFSLSNQNLQKGEEAWIAPLSNDYLYSSRKKVDLD